MRVLHLITSLHSDGAQRVLLRLLRPLRENGIESLVLSLSNTLTLAPDYIREGARVECLEMNTLAGLASSLKRLRFITREYGPDVFHGWMYHGNIMATLAHKLSGGAGIPVCWNVRTSVADRSETKFVTRMIRWLNGCMSASPSCVVYCADESRSRHEGINFHPRRTAVIPNGFDTEQLSPRAGARDSLLGELGLTTDAILIGNLGRFHPSKDHGTLLRAAGRVIREDPRVHFLLAGTDIVPGNRMLRELVEANRMEPHIHLLGCRSDVPELLSALSLYCSSSTVEGFPNAIAEAMACAIPVIATDAGGSREVIGSCGRIVPCRDPAHLSDAILSIIRQGPAAMKETGASARRRIEVEYSLNAMVRRYGTMYRALCSRPCDLPAGLCSALN